MFESCHRRRQHKRLSTFNCLTQPHLATETTESTHQSAIMESANETNATTSHQEISRPEMRNEVERILSRTILRIPHGDPRRTARRTAARKRLAVRIEQSLYRRAPDMAWYSDRTALGWRVVEIAKEMMAASMRRSAERAARRQSSTSDS